MISLKKTLEAIADKIDEISKAKPEVQTKVVTRTVDIGKGKNTLGSSQEIVGIPANKILSITGVVKYSQYTIPLPYPHLNYSNPSYIEWAMACIVVSESLQIISANSWGVCTVKLVIQYKE